MGSAGVGKSTTATNLFTKLKQEHVNCEYVHEYAKDLTWLGHHNTLACQEYVFGKQSYRVKSLLGQVDFIITDSPIILSTLYTPEHYPPSFKQCVIDMFKVLPNFNFYIPPKKKYNPVGRNQTELESREIDEKLRLILMENKIGYITLHHTHDNIVNRLKDAMIKNIETKDATKISSDILRKDMF